MVTVPLGTTASMKPPLLLDIHRALMVPSPVPPVCPHTGQPSPRACVLTHSGMSKPWAGLIWWHRSRCSGGQWGCQHRGCEKLSPTCVLSLSILGREWAASSLSGRW